MVMLEVYVVVTSTLSTRPPQDLAGQQRTLDTLGPLPGECRGMVWGSGAGFQTCRACSLWCERKDLR